MRAALTLATIAALTTAARAADPPAPQAVEFFESKVRPVLAENCFSCHGPEKQKGGLRLDSYDMLMKGGKDGPVLLPRRAENSLLIQRVTLPANNQHFMPAEGRPPLKPDQIASIRAWIEQGASPDANSVGGIS